MTTEQLVVEIYNSGLFEAETFWTSEDYIRYCFRADKTDFEFGIQTDSIYPDRISFYYNMNKHFVRDFNEVLQYVTQYIDIEYADPVLAYALYTAGYLNKNVEIKYTKK